MGSSVETNPLVIEAWMSDPSRRARIKERLRTERGRLGLTKQAVAQSVGVTAMTISRWERDGEDALPPADKLAQLADLYEVSADYLVGRTDHPTGLPVLRYIVDTTVVEAVLAADSMADLAPMLNEFGEIPDFGVEVPPRPKIVTAAEMRKIESAVSRRLRSLRRRRKK